jgi:hypothetical protein
MGGELETEPVRKESIAESDLVIADTLKEVIAAVLRCVVSRIPSKYGPAPAQCFAPNPARLDLSLAQDAPGIAVAAGLDRPARLAILYATGPSRQLILTKHDHDGHLHEPSLSARFLGGRKSPVRYAIRERHRDPPKAYLACAKGVAKRQHSPGITIPKTSTLCRYPLIFSPRGQCLETS